MQIVSKYKTGLAPKCVSTTAECHCASFPRRNEKKKTLSYVSRCSCQRAAADLWGCFFFKRKTLCSVLDAGFRKNILIQTNAVQTLPINKVHYLIIIFKIKNMIFYSCRLVTFFLQKSQ